MGDRVGRTPAGEVGPGPGDLRAGAAARSALQYLRVRGRRHAPLHAALRRSGSALRQRHGAGAALGSGRRVQSAALPGSGRGRQRAAGHARRGQATGPHAPDRARAAGRSFLRTPVPDSRRGIPAGARSCVARHDTRGQRVVLSRKGRADGPAGAARPCSRLL